MKNGTNPTNSQPVAKGCDDRKPKEENDHRSRIKGITTQILVQ